MAVDMFLKLGDIKGESKDKQNKDQIDVLAWSWGMSQPGSMHSGGGGGAGKVSIQDISFTKTVDKASANLMKFCCNGKQMKEALLTVRKAGDKPLTYLTIKMQDVIISSVSTGGAEGQESITENVTLNFAKVSYEYQPQKDNGSKDGGAIPMGWDIKQNVEM